MTVKDFGLVILRKLLFYIQPDLIIAMIMGACLMFTIGAWDTLSWFEATFLIGCIIFGAISYQMMFLNKISSMFKEMIKSFGVLDKVTPEYRCNNDNNTTNC